MNNKKILKNLFCSIGDQINKLSNKDLEKLDSGKFELSLKIVKSKNIKNEKTPVKSLDESSIKIIIEQLDTANSREEGVKIVEAALENKVQLEIFAKHIDVAVMKSDRVEKIKNNIVDSTVGARLRSGAIQGKKI